MVQMIANATATSNGTAGTADVFMEIGATSGTIKIKRVRVGFGSGFQSAGVDNTFLVQFYRYDVSTAGAPTALTFSPDGGVASGSAGNTSTAGVFLGNIWTARNPNFGTTAPNGATVKIKNGSTGLVLGTTDVQLVDQISINGRALYEWLARDDDDMIVTVPGTSFFAVAIASNVASQVFTVTVDFII